MIFQLRVAGNEIKAHHLPWHWPGALNSGVRRNPQNFINFQFTDNFFFFYSPEEVASGVMQLIEDESYNAAVMTVTKTKGIEILEKWTPRLRKSNL